MANTTIRWSGTETGLTCILEVYDPVTDTLANTGTDLMYDSVTVDGTYTGEVDQALVGDYRVVIKTVGGDVKFSGWVYGLQDDTGTYDVQLANPLLATIPGLLATIDTAVDDVKGGSWDGTQSLDEIFASLDGIASQEPSKAPCTLTIKSAGVPVPNALVYVTTDEAGLVRVEPERYTNDAGQVTFQLTPNGTYYRWVDATGFSSTNPIEFTAVQDS
jgi:hypothetical protein